MAQLTEKDIKKVANLAKIEVNDNECQQLASQVGSILNWVEKLQEVDTNQVEALTNVHESNLRLNKDEVTDGNIAEDVIKNSESAKYGYFTVPKVIE